MDTKTTHFLSSQNDAGSVTPKSAPLYKYIYRGTMEKLQKLRSRLTNNQIPEELDDGLEQLEEYNQRWRSVRIIYFTMFLMSLGFSIILTGIWPFLKEVRIQCDSVFRVLRLVYYYTQSL